MDEIFLILLAVIAFILTLTVILSKLSEYIAGRRNTYIPPERQFGNYGEDIASEVIQSVIREGDYIYRNIEVEYDGNFAEFDNIIVNQYGVFIIEVKSYKGWLVGDENDYYWKKLKTTEAGNTYEKTVDNPIKKVKRQIHILAKHLESFGTRVWIKGYVIILFSDNLPESDLILRSYDDIDMAIHTFDRKMLSQITIDSVRKIIEQERTL